MTYEHSARKTLQRLTSGARCFVAVDADGAVVGFANGGKERDGHPYFLGELYTLYVRPTWQAKGIGESLVEVVVSALYSDGICPVAVWCIEANARARRFYERLGGRAVRHGVWNVGSQKIPEVCYELPNVRVATLHDRGPIQSLDPEGLIDRHRIQVIESSISSGSCFVAEQGGCIAGYGVLTYSFFHCGFIELLYVRETMRRHGVGRAILRKMEKLCVTNKLFASTNESNAAMRSLLLSQGFIPRGEVENLDDDDPELIFFKRLTRP